MFKISLPEPLRVAFSVTLILVAIAIFTLYFIAIPIEGTNLALDWQGLWLGIEGATPRYGNETGLRIPPWSLVTVLPLGLTSLRVSWALVSFATIAALVLSVPKPVDDSRKARISYYVIVLILILSYPSLRVIADGNFEYLVIAGVLLLAYAYAEHKPGLLVLGALLATTKIQETWIMLLLLPLFLWFTWSLRDWLKGILTFALITIPSLYWKGAEWVNAVFAIEQRGGIVDSSLLAMLNRFGLPPTTRVVLWILVLACTVFVTWKCRRTLSRPLQGFLIAASLLLTPYAAGNSYLTIYTIGVIPLLQFLFPAGLALAALTNAPYLLFLKNWELMFHWSAVYWGAMFLLTWIILGIFSLRRA